MADEDYEIWLKRAESNIRLAINGKQEGVFFEDLCFEAQQAAEKALKAMLIFLSEEYPRVHSFGMLLECLEKHIKIPERIKDVIELSDYAVQTRYPGDYYPLSEDEYERAINIAKQTLTWVKENIKK